MIIDSIISFLSDEDLGVIGEDMFVGELPFDDADVISLNYAPSPEPDTAIAYFNQTIDIWARYASFDDGYRRLQDIVDMLHQKENYELNGYHVYLSYLKGTIEDLDRDSERRHLFKVSLGFIYRNGVSSS